MECALYGLVYVGETRGQLNTCTNMNRLCWEAVVHTWPSWAAIVHTWPRVEAVVYTWGLPGRTLCRSWLSRLTSTTNLWFECEKYDCLAAVLLRVVSCFLDHPQSSLCRGWCCRRYIVEIWHCIPFSYFSSNVLSIHARFAEFQTN